jgi:hypothetical protein
MKKFLKAIWADERLFKIMANYRTNNPEYKLNDPEIDL